MNGKTGLVAAWIVAALAVAGVVFSAGDLRSRVVALEAASAKVNGKTDDRFRRKDFDAHVRDDHHPLEDKLHRHDTRLVLVEAKTEGL